MTALHLALEALEQSQPTTERAVLTAILETLERANKTPVITNTIWHSNCETLFDFISARIEAIESTPRIQQAIAALRDAIGQQIGATHYQPHQRTFYKRLSATEWQLWAAGRNEWIKSPGTSDSSEWVTLDALAAPQPAAPQPDAPLGAIVNGRAYAERVESLYNFECEAGPLRLCSDWVELLRCFEHLAEHALAAPQPVAVPMTLEQCAMLAAAPQAPSRDWFSVTEIAEAAQYAEVSDGQFTSMLIALNDAFKARAHGITKEGGN